MSIPRLTEIFEKIFSTNKIRVSVSDTALPTGAATETTLTAIKDTAGIKKITDSLPAGSEVIGKVGIDQSEDGVTNKVVAEVTGSNAPLSGQKVVAVATTREALGGDQAYKKIIIIAHTTNTGLIYVGSVTVTSANGVILPAGAFVELEFVNTNEVYIDASVSGEGVSWIGVI